ncbi:MAG: sugar phosphate isomerase/epimerase [Gemmatimonadaceae bacterium]
MTVRDTIQLGVSTWVWTSPATTAVLDALIPHVAQMGYDVIELPVEVVGQFDVRRVGEMVAAHSLGVSICAVIGSGRDLLLPDEVDRGVEYLKSCVDIAHALRSPTVAGPFYSAVGRCWRSSAAEREGDVDRVAGVLRGVGEYAADRGVTLGIETLNRFETSFLNTTAQALELVRRVDHPGVGIALDLFHMGIEEKNIGDALRAAGERLVHVQVAENDRGTPGTGHLPWPEIAEALRDISYSGRVVIETFSDRVETIARAAAIWRPLAHDADTLARDGLAFLRSLLAAPFVSAIH